MKRAPRAYVAGPITSSGSLHENIHNGIKVGDELLSIGIHPFIPHLYDFTKIVTGVDHNWETMLTMDENWITACDLLVALPGESRGKAREIAFAKARHIPVIELEWNSIFVDGLDEDHPLPSLDREIIPQINGFLKVWNSTLQPVSC